MRPGAHGPELQADTAARKVHMPLAVHDITRLRLATEQPPQAPALQTFWRRDVGARSRVDTGSATTCPAGRLTSRLRQRSIAAQAAGPGGNEVKVGARHARERLRPITPDVVRQLNLRGAEGSPRADHNSEGGSAPLPEDLTGGVGNG